MRFVMPPFGSLQFTASEVKNAFLELDSPYGVLPLISLCTIFKRSLVTCIFPDSWKLSFVTPIFKSGNDLSNYRGIAILSAITKLFEMLVYRVMYMYKDLKSRLADCQHGFVKESRLSRIRSNIPFLFRSQLKMAVRWIRSTRIFQSIR
jgi:hypothetical protein